MTRERLSQLADWELVDEEQDLRGRQLLSADGVALGTIRDLIVDTETGDVEAIVLDDGTTYVAREFELQHGAAVLLDAAHGASRAPATSPEPTVRQRRIADPGESPTGLAPRAVTAISPADAPVDLEAGAERAARPRSAPDALPAGPFGESRPIVIRLRGEELYARTVPVVAGEIVIEKRATRFTERVTETLRREVAEVVSEDARLPARDRIHRLTAGSPGRATPAAPGSSLPAPAPERAD